MARQRTKRTKTSKQVKKQVTSTARKKGVKPANIIELNGQRFDARTGQALGAGRLNFVDLSPAKPAPLQPIVAKKQVDGFVRSQDQSRANHATAQASHAVHHTKTTKAITLQRSGAKAASAAQKLSVPSSAAPTVVSLASKTPASSRQPAAHTIAHQPQKAGTLMRHTVHKPAADKKPGVTKLQAKQTTGKQSSSLAAKPAGTIALKSAAHTVNEARLARSQTVVQHAAIARFAQPRQTLRQQIAVRNQPLTVVEAPAAITSQAKIFQAPASRVSHSEALFARAMERSTSHQQTYQASKPINSRGRALRWAVGLVATAGVIIAVLFVGLQNRLGIEAHWAASRAGFAVAIPSYQPVGFSYHGLDAQPGQVSMHYNATATEGGYTLTQEASAWNSQALLENFVVNSGQSYQTAQANGQTVYLYGGHNATWVNGGVWYRITGDDGTTTLGTNDLLRLAASL